MELSYIKIQPYLHKSTQEGNRMICIFKFENKKFESESTITKGNEIGSDIGSKIAKNAGMSQMRSFLTRLVKKNIEIKNDVTINSDEVFTDKEKEAAIVNAFKGIMNEIIYDSKEKKWRIASGVSEFEKRMKKFPLVEIYDKKIMARMLVEMARADQRIEEQERLFFESFLTPDTGKLGDLMRSPYLTYSDCEKVNKKARNTLFLVVAAVALTDNEFNIKEQEKLNSFAKMLDFDDTTKEKLLAIAQDYTLQLAIRANNNNMTSEYLFAFADKIGMNKEDAERTQKRLQ
ncbi:MAG: TerB family tellurite resistance protein [Saprospiraceae bacterium]|nr:TerB family tellurite resistance protein [Saprospiraceae bacterium]